VAKDFIYFGFRQGESRLETHPKNQREVVAADKQQRQKDSIEKKQKLNSGSSTMTIFLKTRQAKTVFFFSFTTVTF
jgi:hypothetical protein